MWSWRRGEGRWVALTLACLSANCGRGAPPAAPDEAAPGTEFAPAALDLDRPCTLVTAQDAANISGLQFYRTMAANLVEPHHVRCAQGVGAYGLHGMVELDVAFAAEGSSAQALFVSACQPLAPASPPPAEPTAIAVEGDGPAEVEQGATQSAEVEPPPPVIRGRHCVTHGGGYALLLPDRVLLMRVRESAGEIDAPATRRLASLVSRRIEN